MCGEKHLPPKEEVLSGDHPRVCGEKILRMVTAHTQAGSPPRVRGKVKSVWSRCRPTGITPACAGKSSPIWLSAPSMEDHPRVCGEKKSERIL